MTGQQIDPTNTRRFIRLEDRQVLAVYDQNRTGSFILFAELGTDEQGRPCFVSEPRSYWPDEVEEA